MEIAYSVIWGQCSETLQHKLKNSSRWETISTTQNPIDLLEQIKIISYRYEEDKYLPMSIHNAKSAFYKFNQRDLSLNDYRERYTNVVEIATSYDNKLYDEKLLDHLSVEKYKKKWKEMLEDPEYYEDEMEDDNMMASDLCIDCPDRTLHSCFKNVDYMSLQTLLST